MQRCVHQACESIACFALTTTAQAMRLIVRAAVKTEMQVVFRGEALEAAGVDDEQ